MVGISTKRKKGGRKRMGRPPGPAEQVRRNKIGITVTDAEKARLEKIADDRGVPISVVIYDLVSRMLRRHK
jgi:hypothetical protein